MDTTVEAPVIVFHIPEHVDLDDLAWERLRQCMTALQGVPDERVRNELADSLQRGLDFLESLSGASQRHNGTTGRVDLRRDWAPLSFRWVAYHRDGTCFYNGGLVFHGEHDRFGDGGMPTLSVSLLRQAGWEIHS